MIRKYGIRSQKWFEKLCESSKGGVTCKLPIIPKRSFPFKSLWNSAATLCIEKILAVSQKGSKLETTGPPFLASFFYKKSILFPGHLSQQQWKPCWCSRKVLRVPHMASLDPISAKWFKCCAGFHAYVRFRTISREGSTLRHYLTVSWEVYSVLWVLIGQEKLIKAKWISV